MLITCLLKFFLYMFCFAVFKTVYFEHCRQRQKRTIVFIRNKRLWAGKMAQGAGLAAVTYDHVGKGPCAKIIEKPALEEGLRSSPLQTHVTVSQNVCQGPLSGNGRSTPTLRSAARNSSRVKTVVLLRTARRLSWFERKLLLFIP